MKCMVCGIELESDRAKTCSPKCRKILSRQQSVTQSNVSVTKPVDVTESVTFKFTIKHKPLNPDSDDEDVAKKAAQVRSAKYWYDVPLAAIPVLEKDWPAMPEYMNGRQYFLWWKNNFEVKAGSPVIHNPFPVHDNVRYEKAGEGSRRWGTV